MAAAMRSNDMVLTGEYHLMLPQYPFLSFLILSLVGVVAELDRGGDDDIYTSFCLRPLNNAGSSK